MRQTQLPYERDFRYFSYFLDTDYPLVSQEVSVQSPPSDSPVSQSPTINESLSSEAVLQMESDERESLLEGIFGNFTSVHSSIDTSKFRVLIFNEVIQGAKIQKFEEFSEYEKNLAEESKLISYKSKIVEAEEQAKQSRLAELRIDRKRIIGLIYKRFISFQIDDHLKKKAEEEKKKQIELQKKDEEKKKEKSEKNKKSSEPVLIEQEVSDQNLLEKSTPRKEVVVVKNEPILYFLFKDFPSTKEEINLLLDCGVNFDCIVKLGKEKKRGPPPISVEDLSQRLGDKKKRPKSTDTKRPKSAKNTGQKKGSTQTPSSTFLPKNRICSIVENLQKELRDENISGLIRNILQINHPFIEYIYDDDNSKFDPGDSLEREVGRFFSTLENYAKVVMDHYDDYEKTIGKLEQIFVSDEETITDLSYYNKLLENIPDGCCSEAVILHCLIEQVVKTVEDKYGPSSNGDDKKLSKDYTESLTNLLQSAFNTSINFLEISNLKEKQIPAINTLELNSGLSLIPFGSKISEHALFSVPIHHGTSNIDIERKFLRMLHLFPKLENEQTTLETDEERVSRKTEIYHFLSGRDEDVHGPYRYSREEIEKELILFEFEEMLREKGIDLDLIDRTTQEHFNVETMIEVISNIGLFEKPYLISKYNELNNSVLLAFFNEIPPCRYERISMLKRFSINEYFFEWFSKYQSYFSDHFKTLFEKEYQECHKRIQKMSQFGIDDEENHKETIETTSSLQNLLKLPLPNLPEIHHEIIPDPKKERYIFEGRGADIYIDTVNLYPSDGAIIYLKSEYCIDKSISCTVEKDGLVFGFKNTIKSLDNPHNMLKRKSYFSCSYEDDSSLVVFLQDQLDGKSTELDFSCNNGLQIRLMQDGSIHQFYPSQLKSKKQVFGSGFKGLDKNYADKMTISLHPVEELIEIWNSSTDSVEKKLVRELSLTVSKDGVIIRRFECGISQTLFPSSEIHHFNSDGSCLKTSPSGMRCVEFVDGTILKLGSVKYVKNVDAWKDAEVHVREDLVMKVVFSDGSQLVQYSDGFRIWRCPIVHGKVFMDQEDEDEFLLINEFYTLVERSGYASVKILKNRILYELPDQSLFTYMYGKQYTLSKLGHIITVDLEKNFVDLEPSSLSFTSINKERFQKKSSKYYFGMYSFDYLNGGMKMIDIVGHEFVVTGTGRSMIKFYHESEKNHKDIHNERMLIEERKASRACTPKIVRSLIPTTEITVGESEEQHLQEDVETYTLSQSLINHFKKNKIGLPPVSVVGEIPKDNSHRFLLQPRLFELSMTGEYAFEYLPDSFLTPVSEASITNPEKINISEEKVGEFRSVSSVHVYTRYDQGTKYLDSPENHYSIPKAVVPLGRLKNTDPSLYYHRHFNKYRLLSIEDRSKLRDKINRWKEWRLKKEEYMKENYTIEESEDRSQEQKQKEEEIKNELSSIFSDNNIFGREEPQLEEEQIPEEFTVIKVKNDKEKDRGLNINEYKREKNSIPKYWSEPEALEIWKSLVLGIPKKEKKEVAETVSENLENSNERDQRPIEKNLELETVVCENKDLEEKKECNKQSDSKFSNPHDPSFYSVENVSKSVWFKKSFIKTAESVPNQEYKSLHDPSKIIVKTSSMKIPTQTAKTENFLPTKIEMPKTSIEREIIPSPSPQPGLSNIQVFPSACNFGSLMVGDVYRMSVQMINSGHTTGRFQIDYQNRSQWFAMEVSDQSINSTLRVYCDRGPIAPGINRKIEFEIHALRPQKIQYDVQIRTEETIIILPVSATILSQQDDTEKLDDWFNEDDEEEESIDEEELINSAPSNWRQASKVEDLLERLQLHKEKQNGIKKQKSPTDQDRCDDPLDLVKNLQPSKLKHGLNPYEDGFIPTKYLGNLHSKFSFSALKNARKTCIKRKENQSNKLRQFVHDNLEKYVYLKDKLEEFLIGDREGRNIFNDNAVAGLEQSFDALQSSCKVLFSPMIKTQQMGEEIRSMVNIVDKLKFLFIIPSDIKQNRERKEYKKIILDYKKAKYFIKGNNTSKVLVSLRDQITAQVEEVKTELFTRLKDSAVSIEVKERYVGYLYLLDAKQTDPVKFFLSHQYNSLIDKMQDIFSGIEDYISSPKPKSIKSARSEVDFYDEVEGMNIEHLLLEEEIMWSFDSLGTNQKKVDTTYQLLILDSIKKLCDVLHESLHTIWKFSKYSLENKYQPNQQKKLKRSSSELARLKEREKQIQKEAEIESIFTEICNLFSIICRELFEKLDCTEYNQSYLTEGLNYFVTKLGSISELKIPPKYSKPFFSFVKELKTETITKYCERTIEEIRILHIKEDWIIVKESNTTQLPLMFLKHTYELLNILSIVTAQGDNFSEIKRMFVETLLSFADTLFEISISIDEKDFLNSMKTSKSSTFSAMLSQYSNVGLNPDKKLMILLRNIYELTQMGGALEKILHTFDEKILSKEVVSELNGDYNIDLNVQPTENRTSIEKKAKEKFSNSSLVRDMYNTFEKLSNIILKKWLRRKAIALSGTLRKGIIDPGFRWATASTPTTIRSYMIETLLGLALVHHEANMKAKSDLPSFVCRELKKELLKNFNDCCMLLPEDTCANGILQLDIEISFFDECLSYFDSEESSTIFSKIRGKLIDISEDIDYGNSSNKQFSLQLQSIKEKVIEIFKEKTKEQLVGFKNPIQGARQQRAPTRRMSCMPKQTLQPNMITRNQNDSEDQTTRRKRAVAAKPTHNPLMSQSQIPQESSSEPKITKVRIAEPVSADELNTISIRKVIRKTTTNTPSPILKPTRNQIKE